MKKPLTVQKTIYRLGSSGEGKGAEFIAVLDAAGCPITYFLINAASTDEEARQRAEYYVNGINNPLPIKELGLAYHQALEEYFKLNLPKIQVDVRGGVAYCEDERVQIIDHDNEEEVDLVRQLKNIDLLNWFPKLPRAKKYGYRISNHGSGGLVVSLYEATETSYIQIDTVLYDYDGVAPKDILDDIKVLTSAGYTFTEVKA